MEEIHSKFADDDIDLHVNTSHFYDRFDSMHHYGRDYQNSASTQEMELKFLRVETMSERGSCVDGGGDGG